MHEILSNSIVAGALTGIAAAAVVDVAAFRSWKNADEALRYDWKTAAWRWFQGAVSGAMVALGIAKAT